MDKQSCTRPVFHLGSEATLSTAVAWRKRNAAFQTLAIARGAEPLRIRVFCATSHSPKVMRSPLECRTPPDPRQKFRGNRQGTGRVRNPVWGFFSKRALKAVPKVGRCAIKVVRWPRSKLKEVAAPILARAFGEWFRPMNLDECKRSEGATPRSTRSISFSLRTLWTP